MKSKKLIGHRKLARGEKPDSPFYTFVWEWMLIPVDMFDQYYDIYGEIKDVALGNDLARRN